jgi:hypothetical protein
MECKLISGQKVVCINATPQCGFEIMKNMMDGLTVGEVYTIDSLYLDDMDGEPCVILKEIVRKEPFLDFLYTPGFLACRFRPLETRKTDISVFTELLKMKEEELI